MTKNIRQKQVSFGEGLVDHFSPEEASRMTTFKAVLDFDAVLRLKAAVDEAAATMNRHNHATREGKRAAMWLCFFPTMGRSGRFTVGRTQLRAKKEEK